MFLTPSGVKESSSLKNISKLLAVLEMLAVTASISIVYHIYVGKKLDLAGGEKNALLVMLAALVVLYFYYLSRYQKRNKYQSFEWRHILNIAVSSLIFCLLVMSVCFFFQLSVERLFPMVLGAIYFLIALGFYFAKLFLFKVFSDGRVKHTRCLVYGAGEAGSQLVSALQLSSEIVPVGFIDDNKLKQGKNFCNIPVHSFEDAEQIVKLKGVHKIIIAMPSVPINKRDEIVSNVSDLPCKIEIMPPDIDIYQKEKILNSLLPVHDVYPVDEDTTEHTTDTRGTAYQGKTVFVSGAGGSIGTELCRQLLKFSPEKLILYEQSELALYEVEQGLSQFISDSSVTLVPVLGDVCDAKRLKHVFNTYGVEIVFHAAAYKHVPLVEANEVAGIQNNVIGTHTLASQAFDSAVETFVLISSDKAVRPKSVMGASKRLAELIIQDFDSRSRKTKFSMVRFGNVLGSSGSVVPLFKKQIAAGGPVTLTHPDVSRYFMAISEAVHLVIEAGNFAAGGEVFVLNMGEPVKISELARNLIEKSNLTVRDEANPDGDIEFRYIGLRPGEKLFEELLINPNTITASHPKIFIAVEKRLKRTELAKVLRSLNKAIEDNDSLALRRIVFKAVEKNAEL